MEGYIHPLAKTPGCLKEKYGSWIRSLVGLFELACNFIWIDKTFSYRQVPTFGRNTIRHFHSNSSKMKKMAARDLEDLLLVLWSLSSILSLSYGHTSVPSLFLTSFYLNLTILL